MSDPSGDDPGSQQRFRVGAVASLTGLPAGTIRTWERRYEAVMPTRSEAGGRRYSTADVQRLMLLKRLTDAGYPIGEIAKLSVDALEQRLQHRGHLQLSIGISANPLLEPFWESMSAHKRQRLPGEQSLNKFRGDVLVVSLEDLGDTPVEKATDLRRFTGARLFVQILFAPNALIEALENAGVWPLHGARPDVSGFARLVRLLTTSQGPEVTVPAVAGSQAVRKNIFSQAALARLMTMTSSNVCDCPRHLAQIIASLDAFERYSRACEDSQPDDALLHAQLAQGTARARQVMEDLLVTLCEAENVAIESNG